MPIRNQFGADKVQIPDSARQKFQLLKRIHLKVREARLLLFHHGR
jgi:hypothetical protein